MTKFRGALIAIAMVAFAVGCAKPPQAEIDSAKAALESARAEAAEYAPEAFSAAEDAMANLETELKAQEEKFALMRRYETSKQLAASATDAANTAAQQAAAEKLRLQEQSTALIAQAKTSITEASDPGRLGAQGQGIAGRHRRPQGGPGGGGELPGRGRGRGCRRQVQGCGGQGRERPAERAEREDRRRGSHGRQGR